jgi:ADP-ribosyl-[dinitrogen reductase] hydrolase
MPAQTDRANGVLLGLACGDALGRPVEFKPPHRIADQHGRVTDMLANGTHRQPAGTITDDTELALRIARSLDKEGKFEPLAVVDGFVEWYDSDPFDIGGLTAATLRRLAAGGDWDEIGIEEWKHLPEGQNAGNGSVMRCAPYGVAFCSNMDNLVTASRVSSAITHADPRCQWSCVVLNATIAGLLSGDDDPLGTALDVAEDAPTEVREAVTSIQNILSGDIDPNTVDLQNSGYVVTTLQAGLYHSLTAETAEEAIIDAVMMGGDTDTIAAVAGAVAGARFGREALPDRWLNEITKTPELTELSHSLVNETFGVFEEAQEMIRMGRLDLQL